MRITTENGQRTARGTTRGSPLPLVSTQSGEPGDAVDRAGAGLQRRIAFAATPSPSRVYDEPDRKSTRLNSSHRTISYAVFCLKKKNIITVTHLRPILVMYSL